MRYPVLGRDPPHAAAVATIQHLRLGPGSETEPSVALEPGWSLFSLELTEPRSAVFVRTDEPLDLTGPFIVSQQRDGAREALTVALPQLVALADRVPTPADPAFLFSTGRCGSTLASRIVARLPGVVSLSEPDVYSNLVEARGSLSDRETVVLLRAVTALLCHATGAGDADRVVIKPRSESVLHEEAYTEAFPAARHAFMYRDVLGYTASITRFARRILGDSGHLPRMPAEGLLGAWNQLTAYEPPSTLGRLVDLERSDIGFHEIAPTVWALRMRAHHRARQRGGRDHAIEAIHYDDLVADRETGTARLLSACGLDDRLTPQVLAVFERDAHAGTPGANAVRVPDLRAEEVEEVVRQLPALGLPTYEDERL